MAAKQHLDGRPCPPQCGLTQCALLSQSCLHTHAYYLPCPDSIANKRHLFLPLVEKAKAAGATRTTLSGSCYPSLSLCISNPPGVGQIGTTLTQMGIGACLSRC